LAARAPPAPSAPTRSGKPPVREWCGHYRRGRARRPAGRSTAGGIGHARVRTVMTRESTGRAPPHAPSTRRSSGAAHAKQRWLRGRCPRALIGHTRGASERYGRGGGRSARHRCQHRRRRRPRPRCAAGCRRAAARRAPPRPARRQSACASAGAGGRAGGVRRRPVPAGASARSRRARRATRPARRIGSTGVRHGCAGERCGAWRARPSRRRGVFGRALQRPLRRPGRAAARA
jgi:hypothetical protein